MSFLVTFRADTFSRTKGFIFSPEVFPEGLFILCFTDVAGFNHNKRAFKGIAKNSYFSP